MSPDVEVRHSKYGGNGTFSTVRELIKYPGSFLESGRSISKSLITTPRYGQTRVRGGRVISRDRGEKFCISIELSVARSEEHTSELQSHLNLVCRLLLEK